MKESGQRARDVSGALLHPAVLLPFGPAVNAEEVYEAQLLQVVAADPLRRLCRQILVRQSHHESGIRHTLDPLECARFAAPATFP